MSEAMTVFVWLAFLFVVLFATGCTVGSFLNVVVARLPAGMSLYRPASRCGSCLTPIARRDNLPLVSYLRLKGRCRSCGVRFSAAYFWVELLTGLGFAGIYLLELVLDIPNLYYPMGGYWYLSWGVFPPGFWVVFGYHALLLCLLIAYAGCVREHGRVPRSLLAAGLALGLAGATLFPWPWPSLAHEAIQMIPPNPALTISGPSRQVVMADGGPWAATPYTPRPGLYNLPAWGPPPAVLPPRDWRLGLATGLAGVFAGAVLARSLLLPGWRDPGPARFGAGEGDYLAVAGAFLGWQPVAVAAALAFLPAAILAWLARRSAGPPRHPLGAVLTVSLVGTWLGWRYLAPSLQRILFNPSLVAGAAAVLGIVALVHVLRGWSRPADRLAVHATAEPAAGSPPAQTTASGDPAVACPDTTVGRTRPRVTRVLEERRSAGTGSRKETAKGERNLKGGGNVSGFTLRWNGAVFLLGLALAAGCDSRGPGAPGAGTPADDSSWSPGDGPASCPGAVIKVIAVENQYGSLVSRLGGRGVRFRCVITNPDADPHEYQTDFQVVHAYQSAQLVVENGLGYDDFSDKILETVPKKPKVVNAGDVLGLKAGDNPHVWYDPDAVDRLCKAITAALKELNPAGSEYFDARAKDLAGRLAPYHEAIAGIRKRFAGTPVGATESVFVPMAKATGLDLISPPGLMNAVAEDASPSVQDVALFHDQVKGKKIKILVYNNQTNGNLTSQLREAAEKAGIPVVGVSETLSPVGATFEDWQISQLQALDHALALSAKR